MVVLLEQRVPLTGSPLEVAVKESYSDSLLASAPVLSAAHPERKSFLVDASALLGGDLTGAQTRLETAYRLAYTLDRANTAIELSLADLERVSGAEGWVSVTRVPDAAPPSTPTNPPVAESKP